MYSGEKDSEREDSMEESNKFNSYDNEQRRDDTIVHTTGTNKDSKNNSEEIGL